MAKPSVGGEVDLNYAPSDLIWRLTCPAANAVEPLGNESDLRGAENRSDVDLARCEQQAVPCAPVERLGRHRKGS
jgi:hypothetical protein